MRVDINNNKGAAKAFTSAKTADASLNPHNKNVQPTQNFDHYQKITDEVKFPGLFDIQGNTQIDHPLRYTDQEILKDLRNKFNQIIETNQAIMIAGGCQTIEGYVCDADCNRIVVVTSNCLPDFVYKPIKPGDVISFFASKYLNALEEDRKYFIKKCNYYKSKGWTLKAYAKPSMQSFWIKFSKPREEIDQITEEVPMISQLLAAQVVLPLLDAYDPEGKLLREGIDPYQEMKEKIKSNYPNKVFMLKYHWDQKEEVCKGLSLPLTIDNAQMSLSSEEYMTSIDGYYSFQAGIYRYSPLDGAPNVPDFNFNNTGGTSPHPSGAATDSPQGYLQQFQAAGEGMNEYNDKKLNALSNSIESLNNV